MRTITRGLQQSQLTNNSETLYEDESFPNRELAALVAAKVYYQLQEYNESMVFALGAGKLFRLDHQGEFEETIVGMCLRLPGLPLNQLTFYSQVHRHVCRSLGPSEPSRSLEFRTFSFPHRIVSRQRQCQRHNPLLAILRPAKVLTIARSRWCSS